jgi:autotransporter-associated beta strand protein
VIATRDAEARTAHYTLDGGGNSLWVGLNNYSPVTIVGTPVFSYPNLMPGTYTVGFNNAANSSGLNFARVRLAIDAIRVHKAESWSATPWFWGSDGRGGSGPWDVGATANWFEGGLATTWQDLGGADYTAVFGGKPGAVTLDAGVKVNRLIVLASGYTLRGASLTLNGSSPTIAVGEGVTATIDSAIAGAEGLTKGGPGTLLLTGTNGYTGETRVNAGALIVGATGALGAGPLTVNAGAICRLGNTQGAVADGEGVNLNGGGKLSLDAGVVECVAGLRVNGTPQAAGTYRAATHPGLLAGAGELVVGGSHAQAPDTRGPP